MALTAAAAAVKANKAAVITAVKQNGRALEHASGELRGSSLLLDPSSTTASRWSRARHDPAVVVARRLPAPAAASCMQA